MIMTTTTTTTATATTTTTTSPPPPPPAHLQATYVGMAAADLGSQGQVLIHVTGGDSGSVFVDVSTGEGLHADCHGDQNIGMVQFSLSGSRSGSLLSLHQDVSAQSNGETANLSISASATLSSDGRSLGGPVGLHVGLPWYYGDCDLNWSFQAQSPIDQVAPSAIAVPAIVGLPAADAMGQLLSVGLALGNEHDLVQMDCGDGVGKILDQSPGAGTLVAPGSAVNFTVGVMPSGDQQCL
jgi:hypothetical protein